MLNGHHSPGPGRWREMLTDFPGMRQVFHALCDMSEGEDATELLGFAARQQWMASPGPGRWREMLTDFPGMRQVFHALCDMSEGEDATELLGFAARQQWMADL